MNALKGQLNHIEMAQSLTQLYVHIIFHIKTTSVKILPKDKADLYAYIGAIIKDNDSIPLKMNGVDDHIHILCTQSKHIAIIKFIEEIKRHSSRWIKGKGSHYSKFSWQAGYGAFSVSPSLLEKTKRYIENQEQHHKRMTFEEEYLLFLKEYGIKYNEEFLWND